MKRAILNDRYLIDFDKREVTDLKTEISRKVEPRLVQILHLLLSNINSVVPREELIRKVWGNYNSGEQLLTHSVALLRKSFETDVIQTVSKLGYVINGKLVRPGIQSWITKRLNARTMAYLMLTVMILRSLLIGHH